MYMKFTRSKKVLFTNNKGGVGKTTISYNVGVKFAEMGYKTVLVDLDPQCNLSLLALGEQYAGSLFADTEKNIHTILRGVMEGGKDIDMSVRPQRIVGQGNGNLYLVRGSVQLSLFENLLSTAINQAAAGQQIGYFQTSAIDRYISQIGLDEEVDIFIIDTSPSLGLLNRIVFLGADFFVVPTMPDSFSLQGIENIGVVFEEWKRSWKNTARALAGSVESRLVLQGEGLFIGYIVNSYNQYNKQPIANHREWMLQFPKKVKEFLSLRHSKNGLVEKSWSTPLGELKDLGKIAPLCQQLGIATFNLDPKLVDGHDGTKENIDIAKQEYAALTHEIEKVLASY
jgi:chromosome partitioning protein